MVDFQDQNDPVGDFLHAKFCQRANPIAMKQDLGQSLLWKHMMRNNFKMEPYIQWKIISGTFYFWWDDWLGVGPLAYYREGITRFNIIRVSAFIHPGQWIVGRIIHVAPPHLVALILSYHIQFKANTTDLAIQKPIGDSEFTCSSAWELIRVKRDMTPINIMTWNKYIPVKCSFHL